MLSLSFLLSILSYYHFHFVLPFLYKERIMNTLLLFNLFLDIFTYITVFSLFMNRECILNTLLILYIFNFNGFTTINKRMFMRRGTKKSTLSFELIILELFGVFTSQRVAGCLSAALKWQPNEAVNKYRESYSYLKLTKKYQPDTCKNDQIRAIQKFHKYLN